MRIFITVFYLMISFGGAAFAEEKKEEPFIYQDKGSRDPFWPLINENGVLQNYEKDYILTDLQLEGIMASPDGKSVAILNGKVVRINDVVGEYTVKEIQVNKVILLKGQQTFELILKKGE